METIIARILLQEDTLGNLERLAPLIISVLNGLGILYMTWLRNKPRVKKMDVEADNLSLEGAKISTEFLVDRLNELREELELEKAARKRELKEERDARKEELNAEKAARKKESDYFRRRIRDADREARDYRQWAAKLVKQVVEAGKIPVPFIPTPPDDSDPSITPIMSEKEYDKEKNDKQ